MSSLTRWIEFLLPQATAMQPGWLRDLVAGDADLLAKIRHSRSARALLTRGAYRHHGFSIPGRATLEPHQQWLMLDHSRQRALARELAIQALSDVIRTTVRGTCIASLRKELGESRYQQAIEQPALAVHGLNRAQFDEALRNGALAAFLLSVGAALLETTTRSGDPFCRLRMRFAFSPACWLARPHGLRVDGVELAARIQQATSQQAAKEN